MIVFPTSLCKIYEVFSVSIYFLFRFHFYVVWLIR